MQDIFMNYEIGVNKLLEQMTKKSTYYLEALTLQSRLTENIWQTRNFGDDERLRQERARIVTELNRIAIDCVNDSFNALCGLMSTLEVMGMGNAQLPRPREYVRFRTLMFAGRQKEIEKLMQSLGQNQAIGLYAFRGMGGIGKSALAAEISAKLDDPRRFPGGVLWANLAEEPPLLIATRWLGNYGYDAPKDNETACLSRLATILSTVPTLVVLDNAQDATTVRKFLVKSQGIAVIITTRNYEAIPAGVFPILLDQLDAIESIKLLENYAGIGRIQNELEISQSICVLCGHLPLALTLAGAQLADSERWPTIASYQKKLEQNRLEMLSRGMSKEDSVRITFEVSYSYLDPICLKPAFAKLGLFAGGTFSLEAVSSLLAIAPEEADLILEQLVDYSLVLSYGEKRYRFHDLLREYAVEKLQTLSGKDVAESKQRLVTHYQDYANRFRNNLEILDLERENLLQAISWVQSGVVDRSLTRTLIELVFAMTSYLKDRGLWVEAIKVAEAAFVSAESQDLLEAQASLATSVLSWMHYYQENFELAKKWANLGLELYIRTGNENGRATATRRLGMICQSQGNTTKAREYLETALEMFQELGNRAKTADTLTVLGYLERKCGNLELAERLLHEALTILESVSDQKEISLTIYQMGRLAWSRGDLKTSRTLHERSLEMDLQLNRTPGLAYNHFCLGLIEEAIGNKQEAVKLFRSARKVFMEMGVNERVTRIETILKRLQNP